VLWLHVVSVLLTAVFPELQHLYCTPVDITVTVTLLVTNAEGEGNIPVVGLI